MGSGVWQVLTGQAGGATGLIGQGYRLVQRTQRMSPASRKSIGPLERASMLKCHQVRDRLQSETSRFRVR